MGYLTIPRLFPAQWTSQQSKTNWIIVPINTLRTTFLICTSFGRIVAPSTHPNMYIFHNLDLFQICNKATTVHKQLHKKLLPKDQVFIAKLCYKYACRETSISWNQGRKTRNSYWKDVDNWRGSKTQLFGWLILLRIIR